MKFVIKKTYIIELDCDELITLLKIFTQCSNLDDKINKLIKDVNKGYGEAREDT